MIHLISKSTKEITGNNRIKFRQFSDIDWLCFAGCESPREDLPPYIAETGKMVIVVDKNGIACCNDKGDSVVYNCEFNIGMILALNIPDYDFACGILVNKYGFEIN